MPACITLLTDFGDRDHFVGVMKGVIAQIAPHARVIDLGHGISPQDVAQGAFQLAASVPYFAPETLHCCVVDPGVGGDRAAVALRYDRQIFVGPDNGLFGGVLGGNAPDACVRLENPRYRLPKVSGTFHGRDVFAPAVAHLALGVELEALGPSHSPQTACPWPQPREVGTEFLGAEISGVKLGGTELLGEVLFFDHFGNATTNLVAGSVREVSLAGCRLQVRDHYSQIEPGEALALVGSTGYVELAIRDGNARTTLALDRGAPVVGHP